MKIFKNGTASVMVFYAIQTSLSNGCRIKMATAGCFDHTK